MNEWRLVARWVALGLILAKQQLDRIFDETSPQYNKNEIDSIKTYSQSRVKEIYHYLEESQQALGKYHSAKDTREKGKSFLSSLQLSNLDEKMNSMRLEF